MVVEAVEAAAPPTHQHRLGQGLRVDQRNQDHHADQDTLKNVRDGKRGTLPVAGLRRAINQVEDEADQGNDPDD